ncbi:hypothetical protein E4H04_04235 [Candidatus Bathyarchaeota archaeon]|jgi:hypothetical protein|nr:MAG: hypothetical protein E4H04_04235 [Candidatus Bathyarchaeota archaeon]
MGVPSSQLVSMGSLFLVIFVSGLMLNRFGRPYNVLTMTFHKLISLATLYRLFETIYQTYMGAGFDYVGYALSALTGLCFIGSIITGGLVSIENQRTALIEKMHGVLPALTVVLAALTLFLISV